MRQQDASTNKDSAFAVLLPVDGDTDNSFNRKRAIQKLSQISNDARKLGTKLDCMILECDDKLPDGDKVLKQQFKQKKQGLNILPTPE